MRTNFSPIFWIFTILDRNFAANLVEIGLSQRNACSNYAPIERTVLRTRSVTNKKQKTKKQTPHFRTYSRRALCDLPQTLHGDRARRAHRKKCHSLLIQRIVFPTGCTEKFGLIHRRAVSQQ